ncbi:MAG: M28 family peptidase [Brevundimonas sp.]|uniref:M28 family peptidase n=1 Tax=Brevundimonas sp. TaxID=1871086 RepID=UPI0025C1603B|nr:M28 family peptidase [Brevundimonas sp.]MBX3476093.1 M28 family peptidase [Brevundimonas sp.]
MRPIPARFALVSLTALALSACMSSTVVEPAAPVPATPQIDRYAQLMDDLRTLSADDMEGRLIGSPGGERARAYLVGRLEAMGVAAPAMGRLQPFEATVNRRDGSTVTFNGTNILGVIPGTRAADRYIVLTAHYDHEGVKNGEIYNGADDNASGVSTLLEIVARLKATAPEHSVLIALVDGEERGLLGAKHFVEAPPVPLTSIAINLNYDMTARAESDGKLWVTGTYQHPNLRPLLEPIPANGAISLAFGKDTPEDTGADNWVMASDHGAFHRAGLPFLYFGVNFHPDYHKPTDDFDKVTPSVFISATELAWSAFQAVDRALDR